MRSSKGNAKALAGAAALLPILISGGCGWEPNTEIDPPRGGNGSASGAVPAGAVAAGGSVHASRVATWADAEKGRRAARTSLHADELRWLATDHDARTAWLVSSETGFAPWGLETSLSEVPVAWHTGRKRHGEEAIYIVRGSGFAIVDGVRFDFAAGSTLGLPYGAERQLFNTGEEPVRYFSATAFPVERHLGLNRLEQLDAAGPNDGLPDVPVSEDGFDSKGRRIRLFWEEARYRDGHVGVRAKLEARVRSGLDLARRSVGSSPVAEGRSARLASGLSHHSAWVRLMGDGDEMGFANRLVRISGFLIDEPETHGGSHAHMEAVLYIVQGEGHSLIDGTRTPWRAGSSLHVQGPQTRHQHFNTGTEPAYLLRVASGARPLVEEAVSDVFPPLWFEAHGESGEGR